MGGKLLCVSVREGDAVGSQERVVGGGGGRGRKGGKGWCF